MIKLIVFGCGSGWNNIKKNLDINNTQILAFTDNNSKIWGTSIDNIEVIPPEFINRCSYDYILITSIYYEEIKKQLVSIGVDESFIVPAYNQNFVLNHSNIINDIFQYEYIIDTKLKKIEQEQKKILESNLMLNARIMIELIKNKKGISSLKEVEFKVFSQWGEDGIIQYLINNIPIKNKTFIEFGVESYKEANTRFLLANDNWRGMVIDGSEENIESIRYDDICWRYDIKPVSAFITKENINSLLEEAGFDRDIGILSVDIDGNDYWVLKEIDVVNPRILICEYNSIFGDKYSVTIPYKKDFYRTAAHHTNLYYGASIKAMRDLAAKKGYTFIGTNSNANNAFFVRNDLVKYIDIEQLKTDFIISNIRESRDQNGKLSFLTGEDRLKVIQEEELYDIDHDCLIKVKDIMSVC